MHYFNFVDKFRPNGHLIENHAGKRFANYEVLRYLRSGRQGAVWELSCSHGKIKEVAANYLVRLIQCACGRRNRQYRLVDLTGKKIGRWTVLERAPDLLTAGGKSHVMWKCQCTCAGRAVIRGENLRKGWSKSCGCLLKEMYVQNRGNNFYYPREYSSYMSAYDRCTNSKNQAWEHYGGRGIQFLFNTFEEFLAEIGPRPESQSLDRIDVNGNYEPGNVRWATSTVQANNRRKPVELIPLDVLQAELSRRLVLTNNE